VELALTGSLAATPPYAGSLRMSVQGTSLDPFLRAGLPRLPPALGIVVSGQAELTGEFERPKDLSVAASVSELQVSLPEYAMKNREPIQLAVTAGSVEAKDLHLAGEGTDLDVSGRLALWGRTPLDLAVSGAADLRVLSLLTRQLRGRGAARLAINLKGPRERPSVDGLLEVEDGALRLRGFPHGIEALHGQVRFTEEVAHFASATGRVGGGPVELEGQVTYDLGRLRSLDIQARGRGLALHYPEGLRSVIDTDLRLLGDDSRQVLTGSVEVRQALWTRRYDLASELLAEGRPFRESESLGSGLRYDIRVKAPGTLGIDNNLATLQARADLLLQGPLEAPVILGRAEVDRGRVYFQGNTYTIRQGTIDFLNPRKLEPFFDIEAETRIQSYRITLKMNGTLERVYPTLGSDPYLSPVQILSLLAGADESTIASLDTAAHREVAQTKLAVTGAATLAAGKISEEVGLAREAERLGLSRFSIDPSVVRGDVTNPTARLTLGKRVTPDLNILYSVDLRGTEERLVSLEYTLSDRLSLLLTRAEPGGFGFDLRLRQTR
jgi:translocation and assembly module TamB